MSRIERIRKKAKGVQATLTAFLCKLDELEQRDPFSLSGYEHVLIDDLKKAETGLNWAVLDLGRYSEPDKGGTKK